MGVLAKLADKVISGLFFLMMVWICAIALFGTGLQIPDWVRKSFLLPNIVLLPLALAVLYLLTEILKGRKLRVGIIVLAVFVIQFLVSYTYFFATGWDAGMVLDKAYNAAFNGVLESPEPYYSFYVNNIMAHCLEYILFKVAIAVGIKTEFTVLVLMVLVQCALSAVTGALVYDITQMLMPESVVAANMSFVMYLMLVITSPWIPVIYTDSMALILPVLMIWIYLRGKSGDRSLVAVIAITALICFLGMFGYRLKAPAFITFVGIVVTEIFMFFKNLSEDSRNVIVRFGVKAAVGVVAVLLSARLFTAFYTGCGIELDPEGRCPFTHYLMMGFNDDEVGTFNFPDSDFAAMESSYQERYDRCLSGAKERIKKMLPFGVFGFEARKTYVNYHDGTFGYGIEGDFYSGYTEDRVSVFSHLFKEIFWDIGSAYPVFATILQGIWMAVLFLGIWFSFFKSTGKELLIKIVLIGIFLFLSLFEARARYVFIYVPVYIVAAAVGLEKVRLLIRKEGE
ncbi:hypothetical protein [Butyrivibrio sp. XPD2006]|uniref:hypothetical protein n=1 Tax=Butyrivibrio sp. XPD2006 TaxID=1280668 RepID=UPI0003B6E46B|nr:hypothetical protein [Butyrivibrio sp. XPD2006]